MRAKDKIALPRVDETERLFDLDQPSLKNLSYILRHEDLWPDGFVWHFAVCTNCAMGMAAKLWRVRPTIGGMADTFGMKDGAAARIFGGSRLIYDYGACCPSSVTPEMVAAQIDKHLGK